MLLSAYATKEQCSRRNMRKWQINDQLKSQTNAMFNNKFLFSCISFDDLVQLERRERRRLKEEKGVIDDST